MAEFFRRWEERVEVARAAHGLQHAPMERQGEMQARARRIREACDLLFEEIRRAQAAGFSTPFLVGDRMIEGASLLLDEKFWHPGDPRARRAIYEVHPIPNPEEAPTR
jgi:hypothetical protein